MNNNETKSIYKKERYMKIKPKISKRLSNILLKNDFKFGFEMRDHSFCFVKGCSHPLWILVVKKDSRGFEFNQCTDDFILKTLNEIK